MLFLMEVLNRANAFREMGLDLHVKFCKILNKVDIALVLEENIYKLFEDLKDKYVFYDYDSGLLALIKLKQHLLDAQNLFYDFSEFLEPMDLIPYLNQNEYKYVMIKMRENNEDIASALRIGNIMFAAMLREVVKDDKRWRLTIYHIKEKWRRQNIRLVV